MPELKVVISVDVRNYPEAIKRNGGLLALLAYLAYKIPLTKSWVQNEADARLVSHLYAGVEGSLPDFIEKALGEQGVEARVSVRREDVR